MLDNIPEILARTRTENKDPPSGKLVASIAFLGKTEYYGHNNKKTHPAMLRKFRNGCEGSCSHAELSALSKVPRQSRHLVVLFVMRFLRSDGSLTMSQPCSMCRDFLRENGVAFRNVFYTTWSGGWEKLSNDFKDG